MTKCITKIITQLKEDVPEDVIAWLESLPESKTAPAWINFLKIKGFEN